MQKLLFLDTETTGLIIKAGKGFDNYYPHTNLEKYNQSRMVSICWKVYNSEGTQLSTHYYVIKPKDFIIDNTSIATGIHGITQEIASGGTDVLNVMKEFHKSLNGIDRIICHNVVFDKRIVSSELYRYDLQECLDLFRSINTYCTCLEGKMITKIKPPNWRDYKIPKLSELYEHLFKEKFKNAHNADADVNATARCYFKIHDIDI